MYEQRNQVKISGRFGNQLFQLCAALFMERSNGKQILLDARGIRPSYLILLWESGLINVDEIRISYYQKKYLSGSFWARIFEFFQAGIEFISYRAPFMSELKFWTFLKSRNIEFLDDKSWHLLLKKTNNVYGYFQDWELVEQVWDLIRTRLMTSRLLDSKLTIENSVFLHVRIGDYIHHPDIGVLSSSYYENAMKKFSNSFSFYVVTDDVDQFNKYFSNLSKHVNFYSGTKNDFESFKILANSENLIIANSTFSYWAGIFSLMLGKNSMVIAPQPWRNDNSKEEILSSLFELVHRGDSPINP